MTLLKATLAIGMTALLGLAGCAKHSIEETSFTEVQTRSSSAMTAANEAKATAKEALELARQAQEDAAAAKTQAMAASERADRTFQSSLEK